MRSLVYFLAAILISACAHLAFVGLFFIPEPKPGSKKNTVYVEIGSSFENLVKGPPLTISKSDFQKPEKFHSTIKPTSGPMTKNKVIRSNWNKTHVVSLNDKTAPTKTNSKVFAVQNNLSEHKRRKAFITTFKPNKGSSISSGSRVEKIIGEKLWPTVTQDSLSFRAPSSVVQPKKIGQTLHQAHKINVSRMGPQRPFVGTAKSFSKTEREPNPQIVPAEIMKSVGPVTAQSFIKSSKAVPQVETILAHTPSPQLVIQKTDLDPVPSVQVLKPITTKILVQAPVKSEIIGEENEEVSKFFVSLRPRARPILNKTDNASDRNTVKSSNEANSFENARIGSSTAQQTETFTKENAPTIRNNWTSSENSQDTDYWEKVLRKIDRTKGGSAGRSGIVLINLKIGGDGRILSVSVKKSSGIVRVDSVAVRKVKRARFFAPTLSGRKESATLRVIVKG